MVYLECTKIGTSLSTNDNDRREKGKNKRLLAVSRHEINLKDTMVTPRLQCAKARDIRKGSFLGPLCMLYKNINNNAYAITSQRHLIDNFVGLMV